MKKIFLTCLVILSFCHNSFAALTNIPMNELVKDSDLIIVGTLQSVSEYSFSGDNYGEGRILIEQIIASKVKTNKGLALKSGDKLKLVWNENFACIYGMHRRTENQKGVWFLKVEKDGTVIAGHPQRFKSLNELPKIRNALEIEKISAEQTLLDAENIKTVDISERSYSLSNAFLVTLASLFLYYFLYRSRFKIR